MYLGQALDAISLIPRQGWQAARSPLLTSLSLLVVMTIIFQGLRTLKRWDLRMMSNAIGNDLRRDLVGSTFAWDAPRFDKESIGDLMSRGVGDIEVVVETIMTTVTEAYDTWVLMLSYFVVILFYDARLTLLASLPVPLMMLAAQLTGPLQTRESLKARRAAAQMTARATESLNAVRVLRLFGREPAEWAKFRQTCQDYLRASLRVTVIQNGVFPFYTAVSSFGVILVISTGAGRVIAGTWTLGRFTAYLSLFLGMTGRMLMAGRVLNRVHAARAAWTRIMEKVDIPGPGAFDEETVAVNGQGLGLTVENLSFSFPGMTEAALKNVSFELQPGDLLAVTGPIGGGKSALVSALSGLYPYEGSIKLEGVEMRDLTMAQRAALIATVDQSSLLFSGSVTENITLFSTGSSMEAVKDAAAASAVDTDVAGFPKGYDTQVGESGVRVSGGQRQRIALARAIYRNAPLLVLDDPFSAVDLITERQILKGLRDEQGRRTMVLCSHRLNTFETADKVLVLENGTVVERGTHRSLLAEDGLYARIYKAQGALESEVA
ncbi:MAG: ABC transporter ATP-binding protein [Bacillota bacterium]|nr:ABC transporter ATP-binding protein [Bacillota bacterium]